MKRCPNCQRTFADSMRFCQIDGTPLVEETENAQPSDRLETAVGGAFVNEDDEDDLLQLSDKPDPTKTPVNSGDSGRENVKFDKADESASPFSSGDSAPKSESKDFGSAGLPEAPKSDSNALPDEPFGQSPFNNPPSSPIPSFDLSPPSYQPPSFKESEQTKPFEQNFGAPQTPFNQSPFDQSQNSFEQPMQQSSWTPPSAPEASWQNQNIGVDTPFQPPIVGQGQNNTLAIVSLVLGILSIPCCGGIVFSLGALITGFLAKRKADENPSEYGGRGMALAGMIIGGITTVMGLVVLVLQILFGILGNLR